MTAGKLKDRIAFDKRTAGTDAFGGASETHEEQFQRACQFIHMSGSESADAARLSGREVYKVKVRSSAAVRAVTTAGWQARDVRRDVTLNIASIDVVTDRAWVWMVCEVQ